MFLGGKVVDLRSRGATIQLPSLRQRSMATKTSTKRTYLEPSDFFARYPSRKSTLSNTLLEKHVSWVLIEQSAATTRKMTYFLMSAAAYGRACREISDLPNRLSMREQCKRPANTGLTPVCNLVVRLLAPTGAAATGRYLWPCVSAAGSTHP